jgi:peptide/nickel transport system substrate-binding protein
LENVVALDDAQVDFHLSRPDPGFPSRLTIGIAPAREQALGDLARAPLGSGPFEFQGWRDDGGLLLKRRLDGQAIALVPVADPTMRALKLLRGEAQLLQNDLPSELYGYLGADPALQVLEHPGTTFAYIGFNLTDPVLRDRDVRAAIAHAIDREAIIRHLFDGRAQTAESVLRSEHWAGAKGLQAYAYDPELARSYLARAGYDAQNPLILSYKTSTDPFRLRIAHVFQSQLASVGIQLKISSYDWGTFFGDIKAGRFQVYSLAWVGVNTPDILRYAFHSESTPPGGANRGRYRSDPVDALIRHAERAAPVLAAALYAAIQHQVHHDLVYVPLWYESNVVASRGLTAYAPSHDGGYQALNQVRIADAAR